MANARQLSLARYSGGMAGGSFDDRRRLPELLLVDDNAMRLAHLEFHVRARPPPGGFVALMRLKTGDRPLVFMADSGASCSAMAEEVVVLVAP